MPEAARAGEAQPAYTGPLTRRDAVCHIAGSTHGCSSRAPVRAALLLLH